MRVLFIEDDGELAKVGRMQLEMAGHDVYAAGDLGEAWAIIKNPELKLHAVIADHCLPDGFGIDFVLQTRHLYPSISYVIVSGCLRSSDEKRLKEKEIEFFKKPLLYSTVIEHIRKERIEKTPVKAVGDNGGSGAGAATAAAGLGSDGPPDMAEPKAPRKKRFFGLL